MRIALAQLNYKLGDFAGNFKKIQQVIDAQSQHADLIVFSELCLSGYYPRDLITEPHFITQQNAYLQKIQDLTKHTSCAVIVGLVVKNEGHGKPFFNSLALLYQGQQLYTYHKRLLPVYNIFNEARHFSPGKKPGIFTFQDVKFGFLICEDGWAELDNFIYDCNPVDDLTNQSLDLIICINGSPSNIGKQQERMDHFSAIAKRIQVPLIFTNQVGGNDDIVFDGASFILDHQGKMLGALKDFEEDCGVISYDKKGITLNSRINYQPITDVELFYQQSILGLKDYVHKCGFKKVVIGVSGGIDSALTLALATQALGSDQVVGLAMPSRYSSAHSLTDAKALCKNFHVKWYVASIEEELQIALTRFAEIYGEKPSSLTEQNIQARLRGRYLMEYSNQTGALVLSCGNKSELSVGYTTLYGDMTGGFNLIGDLYKTDIYKVAEYFNQINPTTLIPRNIFEKAPSAELAPNQKDVDTLPEYPLLDAILKLYIEGDLLPSEEIKVYQALLQNQEPAFILQIHQMVDKAEFKRRQASPIIRMQRRAFGYGRQFPIAATYPNP